MTMISFAQKTKRISAVTAEYKTFSRQEMASSRSTTLVKNRLPKWTESNGNSATFKYFPINNRPIQGPIQATRQCDKHRPEENAMRKAWRFIFFAMAIPMAFGLLACSQRNADINRAEVSPYWTKADFDTKDSWYYTTTVIEGAPNSGGFGGAGEGGFLVAERLKWEITEGHLIGWRDYAAIPGSESDSLAGGEEDFRGQPIAMYPITSHFDIQRNYDALTGEESNVISENTTDRFWYERDYFRVCWDCNVAPATPWRVGYVEHLAQSYAVQPNDPGDPKRFRFEMDEGYFEVTTRSMYHPDIYAMFGAMGAAYTFDTAGIVVDVRHSFRKLDPNNDYIPLNTPSSVALVDDNGDEVRDEDGFAKRMPIFDRFGYFTTWHRRTWDPEYGFTHYGTKEYAIRFNVWEKNRNSDGSEIPMEERTPKPIVWYTNQTHPKQLMNAANRVAVEWNDVFRDMVFHAQPDKWSSKEDVPDMFILRENDCNPANVKSYLESVHPPFDEKVVEYASKGDFDGTIESVIARYDDANDSDNDAPFTERQNQETQALADLERICSALEYITKETNPESFTENFTYQRNGDARYNMFNAIVEKITTGWLGVATILGDPITGEEIQGVANLGLSALDRWAHSSDEAIRALNGEVLLDDIMFSTDVKSYMEDKLTRSRSLQKFSDTSAIAAKMDDRFMEMGLEDREMFLRETSPTRDRERLSRIKDTYIEHLMVSDDDIIAYGGVGIDEAADFEGDWSDMVLEGASVARGRLDRGWESRLEHFDRLGELGIEPVEFLDQFSLGAAMKYRNLGPRERYEAIREDLYVSVMLHEVGHTLGLRHNFGASSDALNYGPEFWEMQQLPEDLDNALGATTNSTFITQISDCIEERQLLRERNNDFALDVTTQECLGENMNMFSTIMEYNGHWTADFGGLGPYDYQAIKFGYAQLLEVFNEPAQDRTDKEVAQMVMLNDWRDIPTDIVNGIDNIMNRSYVKYDWDFASTMQEAPVNTVPYRFCTDSYSTPYCNRWDFGPDMQTNAVWDEYNYYQRYFFTHFNRDKFWDIYSNVMWSVIGRDERVLYNYTEKMKWYVYLKATVPEFTGTYAEQDFLRTTMMGLNHFSHILGHPGSGHYLTMPHYNVASLTNDSPTDPTVDRLAPTDIMRPYQWLSQCEAINYLELDASAQPTGAQPGYNLAMIPLGDGRPFALGSTNTEAEDWILSYIGTYWHKSNALYWLGSSRSRFPKTELSDEDPRNYYISWYRLFPELVGGVIHDFVTENYADLGPLVDTDGNLVMRDLIDLETGEAPDYTGFSRVVPTVAFNHQYQSVLYAQALMSSYYDGQYDLGRSFLLAVEGAEDDEGMYESLASDPETADLIVQFEHPVSHRRYRAVEVGSNPIAANLLRRAEVLKERYEVLDDCVEGVRDPATEPYCQCTSSVEQRPEGLYCRSGVILEEPGTGFCGWYELVNRRDRAQEIMNDAVDFIDDVRYLNQRFDTNYDFDTN
jgi:hypothetical protein